MSLPGLGLRRLISLLMLLMSAAPMRPSPLDAEALSWSWPAGTPKSSYRHFQHNGRPLPKIETREMAPELGEALAKTINFPLHPMLANSRRWSPWQQRYDKYRKDLQVQQTWVGDQQSPAAQSMTTPKRAPILWPPNEDNAYTAFEQSGYPYAYAYARAKALRNLKRQTSEYTGPLFRPSISAGVMTNLGDFFNQLKANVRFAEHSQQLGDRESQLLEGMHPHPLEDSVTEEDADYDSGQPPDRKTYTYRPSQKIRSLVSRNPDGYRGSQFIDPSYMWLGLGK